jgi:hypothetical protein
MTTKQRLVILLALIFAFCCASASAASQRDCLTYEPDLVTLRGRVSLKIFPGRPNYESIKHGDEPEGAWILHLAKPVCVKSDGKGEFNAAVGKVTNLHLVLRGKQFSEMKRLRRKGPITFTGTLFHSFTGHHHAEVLMEVKSMK